MDKITEEIRSIHSLTYDEASELRGYYCKTGTLFSSRAKTDVANIYYKLARECLFRMKELKDANDNN